MSRPTNQKAVFLAYTRFHVASMVRTIKQGHFNWFECIEIIIPKSLPKDNDDIYLKELIKYLNANSIKFRVSTLSLKTYALALIRAAVPTYRKGSAFITGNLRRTPSLILAGLSGEIYIIDEGTGTTKSGEYFDPQTPESNPLKRFVFGLFRNFNYSNAFSRVVTHFTSFSRSIYKNTTSLPFRQVVTIADPNFAAEQSVAIFVASSAHVLGASAYIKYVENILSTQSYSAQKVYYAPHPADPLELTKIIASHFEWSILNTRSLLLEDYILELVRRDVFVTTLGESNTSTALLKLFCITDALQITQE